MNIVFRADASARMGTGHVMRCLVLAEALQARGAQPAFVCREHPGHLMAAIRDFVGGHSKSYERVLARAREDAMKALVKEAEKLGANAILAVDLDYNTVGPNGSMMMVSVSGTAVIL